MAASSTSPPAEQSLCPLVMAMYFLVTNKWFGQKLSGELYMKTRERAPEILEEWYTKHATGAPLMVPLATSIREDLDRFMREPSGKWQAMQWYQEVPDKESQPQPLQERDANVVRTPRREITSAGKRGRNSSQNSGKQQSNNVPSAADTSSVHVDGEEDEEAPIFDTCEDVRKKFNEALKDTTRANMARQLSELLPRSNVSSRQLGAFLKFKGPQAGAHSIAFYAGWVYFEKIRVKEGKKKSAKRKKMERIWGGRRADDDFMSWHSKGSKLGGFPRTGEHHARVTCPQGERWRLDQYGEVQKYGQASGGALMRKAPSKKPW